MPKPPEPSIQRRITLPTSFTADFMDYFHKQEPPCYLGVKDAAIVIDGRPDMSGRTTRPSSKPILTPCRSVIGWNRFY
ncbi:MAG: hypothetical protein PF442_06165 [Desulfobulbaceae bacterium]|nr:hypothetical protein [Desulfobulbaceae bacterium]